MRLKRRLQILSLVVLLTAAFAGWVATGLGGATTTRYVDDLATIVAASLAAALSARAARGQEPRYRASWWLLAIGCSAWALGEVIWAVYDLSSGSVPATSFADIAYLAALPPVAAALLVHPALRGRTIGKTRALVDGLVLAGALFFAAWDLILQPLRRSIDMTSLAGLVTLAYPLGDIVLVFLVVLVVRGTTRRERLDVWWLLVGVLLISLSDSIYTYLTNVRSFSTGGIVDASWFAGYLAIGVAALCSHTHPPVEHELPSPALTRAAIVTPFIAMLGALSLVAVRLGSGHRLDGVSLTLAIALVALVLLRQVLLLVDLLFSPDQADRGIADRLVAAVGEPLVEPLR